MRAIEVREFAQTEKTDTYAIWADKDGARFMRCQCGEKVINEQALHFLFCTGCGCTHNAATTDDLEVPALVGLRKAHALRERQLMHESKWTRYAQAYGMGTRKIREHQAMAVADFTALEQRVLAYYSDQSPMLQRPEVRIPVQNPFERDGFAVGGAVRAVGGVLINDDQPVPADLEQRVNQITETITVRIDPDGHALSAAAREHVNQAMRQMAAESMQQVFTESLPTPDQVASDLLIDDEPPRLSGPLEAHLARHGADIRPSADPMRHRPPNQPSNKPPRNLRGKGRR